VIVIGAMIALIVHRFIRGVVVDVHHQERGEADAVVWCVIAEGIPIRWGVVVLHEIKGAVNIV